MREQDKLIFKQVARLKQVWILVRDTNQHSLRFMGRPQFISKPFECKAKTADSIGNKDGKTYDIRGLVVSVAIWPDVFSDEKRKKVQEEWADFSKAYMLTGKDGVGLDGYSVDMNANSSYYGCVRKNGNYIFGDYDLYDVFTEMHARRTLYQADSLKMREFDVTMNSSINKRKAHNVGEKYHSVASAINAAFAKEGFGPMVHHGAEAHYGDKFMSVHAFSPAGTYEYWDHLRTEQEYRKWKRVLPNGPARIQKEFWGDNDW